MALTLPKSWLTNFNLTVLIMAVVVYSNVESIAWWVEKIPPFRIGIGDTTLCIVGRNVRENVTEASQWIRLLLKADREMIACDVHSSWNTTLNVSCRSRLPNHSRPSETWRHLITSFRPLKGVEESAVKSLLLALWSDNARKYDVYHGGHLIPPSDVNFGPGDLRLEQNQIEKFSTKFNSHLPGDNVYHHETQSHLVVLQDRNSIHIRASCVLSFAMVVSLNAETLDDQAIIRGLASLLNLPRESVRITGVSSDGKTHSPDFVDVEIQVEVQPHKNQDFNLTAMQKVLLKSFQCHKLDYYVNASVSAIKMKPFEDSTNRKRASISHRERWKRDTKDIIDYLKPFKLRLQRVPTTIAANETFQAELAITDQRDIVVKTLEDSWVAQVKMVSWGAGNSPIFLVGRNQIDIHKGIGFFNNLTISQPGSSYRLRFFAFDEDTGMTFDPVTTELIRVNQRTLSLVTASKEPPYMAIENHFLSPIPGVIIVDQLTKSPATQTALEDFVWKATIDLKYDVYEGKLEGNKEVKVQKNNQILFRDLKITKWGYQYELLITVVSEPPSGRNMNITIGPFDVGQDLDEPRVLSPEERQVTLLLDGEYSKVEKDKRRFVVFFLNRLGLKYPKVKWVTATPKRGSIETTSKISGLEENLRATTGALEEEVRNGKMELEYIKSRPWRVKRAAITESPKLQKLPVESGDTAPKRTGESTLPLAWIAAIVINAVLVVLFIVFVVYCYCRSKKRQQAANEDIFEKQFEGDPDRMYNEKAANHLPGMERAVFIAPSGDNPVFTVEDERRRFGHDDDDDEPDRYSTPIDGRRSTPIEYYDRSSEERPEVKNQGTITEEEYDDDLEDDYIQRSRGIIAGYNRQFSRTPSPEQDYPERELTPEYDPGETTPEPDHNLTPTREGSSKAQYAEEIRPVSKDGSRALSRDSLFEDDPMYLPGAVTEIHTPEPDPFGYPDEEWKTPHKRGSDSGHEEMPLVRYSVFTVSETDGSKNLKGNVFLPEGAPITLTHLRTYLASANEPTVKAITESDYIFLAPDLQEITLPEGALIVNRLFMDQDILVQQVDNDWQAPKRKGTSFAPRDPIGKQYSVYKFVKESGQREFLGSITLPVGPPITLTHLRSILSESDLAVNGTKDKSFVFVDESEEDVSGPEGALLVDLLYPEESILLRFNEVEQSHQGEQEHKAIPAVTRKPRTQNHLAYIRQEDLKKKEFAYVGPLGMCNAPECEKPARIKCLACGQVGYCNTRHMREDQPFHKRSCFKPLWKH